MSTQLEPTNVEDTVMSVLEQYGAYPFDSDDTYQQGVASIISGGALGDNPTAEVRDEILRRTRVFYFNKMTGNSVSMDEAREYELSRADTATAAFPPAGEQSSPAVEGEPRVLSFAELKELIESGRVDQIPNNKIIPEKINEEPPSHSTAPVRRKPWEVATPQDA